ncbi:Calx-beta domain-containing protein, partial [Psychrobacter jeotgali]|uniref:Calx-beta domain-containing protein n=1 Tax=Psychrobacter jeotgali TaxID=179010 RepID=UPI001917BE0D
TINPTQNTVNTTIYDDGTTDGETPVDPENPSLGDDTPVVSIIGTTSLNETDFDGTPSEAVYTVNLSNPSTVATSVTITITDGSTEGSADYTAPVTQTITIPAGSTSATFSVPIIDDNVFEGPEDFDVTITSVDSGSATINPTQNTVNTTIYDDGTTDGETPVDPENPPLGDDTPVVSIIGTTSLNETDFDGTPSEAVYTVNLSNPSMVATSVTVTITDGSTEGSAD